MSWKNTLPGKGILWVGRQIYLHLILPFQQSHAPVWEVARGTAIGMFVGITPTVGVQMYVVFLIWLACRLFRLRFNLPIGIAMVWISNPVTFIPMYYGYLKTGQWVLELWWGIPIMDMTYASFQQNMMALINNGDAGYFEMLVAGFTVVVLEFGWPIALGSMVYAVPLTVATYPIASVTLLMYRKRLAAQLGMSYVEWKHKFVRLD